MRCYPSPLAKRWFYVPGSHNAICALVRESPTSTSTRGINKTGPRRNRRSPTAPAVAAKKRPATTYRPIYQVFYLLPTCRATQEPCPSNNRTKPSSCIHGKLRGRLWTVASTVPRGAYVTAVCDNSSTHDSTSTMFLRTYGIPSRSSFAQNTSPSFNPSDMLHAPTDLWMKATHE